MSEGTEIQALMAEYNALRQEVSALIAQSAATGAFTFFAPIGLLGLAYAVDFPTAKLLLPALFTFVALWGARQFHQLLQTGLHVSVTEVRINTLLGREVMHWNTLWSPARRGLPLLVVISSWIAARVPRWEPCSPSRPQHTSAGVVVPVKTGLVLWMFLAFYFLLLTMIAADGAGTLDALSLESAVWLHRTFGVGQVPTDVADTVARAGYWAMVLGGATIYTLYLAAIPSMLRVDLRTWAAYYGLPIVTK